jgi:hypothetical protein
MIVTGWKMGRNRFSNHSLPFRQKEGVAHATQRQRNDDEDAHRVEQHFKRHREIAGPGDEERDDRCEEQQHDEIVE